MLSHDMAWELLRLKLFMTCLHLCLNNVYTHHVFKNVYALDFIKENGFQVLVSIYT